MKRLLTLLVILLFPLVSWGASQNLTGALIPVEALQGAGVLSTTTILNADADDKVAWIFNVGAACTCTEVGLSVAAITSGQPVDVRIETVSTTNGDPTGTLVDTTLGVATNQTLTASHFNWIDVTDAAIPVGTTIAVVVQWTSTAGTSIAFNRVTGFNNQAMPYADVYTTAWAKVTGTMPAVAIKCSGAIRHIPGLVTVESSATETIDSDGTTRKLGLQFQTPFPATIAGVCAYIDSDDDFTLSLLSADGGTVHATTDTIDKDIDGMATGSGYHCYPFKAAYAITKATNYILAFLPGTTGANAYVYTFDAAGDQAGMAGGTNWVYIHATSGGWQAATTTKRPAILPLFSAFDDAVSTGGGGGAWGF